MKVCSLYVLDNQRLEEFYHSIEVLPFGESIAEYASKICPIILRCGNTLDVLEKVNQLLKNSKYNELQKLSLYTNQNEDHKEPSKTYRIAGVNLQTFFQYYKSDKNIPLSELILPRNNNVI